MRWPVGEEEGSHHLKSEGGGVVFRPRGYRGKGASASGKNLLRSVADGRPRDKTLWFPLFPDPFSMKRPCLFLPALVAAVLAFAPSPQALAIGIWHRDYPSALEEAKAEGKKLLVVFSGTDWIEMCAKFYDEILGEPAFIEAVSDKFTLLKLEYPKDNRLPREEAAQKALLRDAYRVRGFPTVVLTDVEGRPFGLNGYQISTPEEYASQLLEIEAAREAGLAAAKEAGNLSGVEKVKALASALPDLPGVLLARFFREEMQAVLAADPGDSLALAEPFRLAILESDFEMEMQILARQRKWEEMIARTDRHIAERKLEGEAKQAALINRAGYELRAGQAEKAETTLRIVVALDSESVPGKEAARLLRGADKDGEEKKTPAPEPTGVLGPDPR